MAFDINVIQWKQAEFFNQPFLIAVLNATYEEIKNADKTDYTNVIFSTPLSNAKFVAMSECITDAGNPLYSCPVEVGEHFNYFGREYVRKSENAIDDVVYPIAGSRFPIFDNARAYFFSMASVLYQTIDGFLFAYFEYKDSIPFFVREFYVNSTSQGTPNFNYTYTEEDNHYIINVTNAFDNIQNSKLVYIDLVENIDILINNTKAFLGNEYPEPDYYTSGVGASSSGGGGGSFNYSSDTIPLPSLPTVSASATGFMSMYKASALELKALSDYLWSDDFSIDNFKKIFTNPMDCLIGLQLVPNMGNISGTSAHVYFGNMDSNVTMTKISSQYIECDCGTLSVDAILGSYLDYAPYTKIQIYLPFIGYQAINPDEIVGGNINVTYHIDLMSATCICFITCTRNGNTAVLYQMNGSLGCSIPVTSMQYSNLLSGALGVVNSVPSLFTPASAVQGVENVATSVVNAMKPSYQRNGSYNGASALMTIPTPYLVFSIPRLCIPDSQNRFIGYPSYITKSLSELSGYNRIEEIHLTDFTCTEAEQIEIERLLKEGVQF